ncbi:MAG: hypothetical protein IAE95_01140 [Chitinophagaceae bacterium]|nr:hypothetical protein [Chitinophagaceae bacterium]
MKKLIMIVLSLGLIGVGTGIYLFNKKPETVDDKKGINIAAADLAKAYSANERAADSLYLNQVIEVSGTVGSTETNQDGGLMVILTTGDPDADIQCTLRDKGVQVAKGAQVTLKGFCSGSGITGVSLTDCIVTK